MHIPQLLADRFAIAMEPLTDDAKRYAEMIRPSSNPQFGDYQCNAAMSLGKHLGQSPQQTAATIVEALDVTDLCDPPTIAGPGFINLRLNDEFLRRSLVQMLLDDRVTVGHSASTRRVLIDFSSPNVAKPMHVGHIRSTVIGDCLARLLRFLGADVTTDNHLGDWGTQFGIIIYGYKHFGDPAIVAADPVPALAQLYRLTNQLIEYEQAKSRLPELKAKEEQTDALLQEAQATADAAEQDAERSNKEKKKARKATASVQSRLKSIRSDIESTQQKISAVQEDDALASKAEAHAGVSETVLVETAKLHAGDSENLALWQGLLPHCKDEINRIYNRLDVHFDHVLGESFYHDRLAGVVEELDRRGLTTRSDGAVCVFVPGFDAPMIIQKRDGAYLYATTDLATLQYRQEVFDPTEILYVVDSRQGEHFEKFFAMAEPLGIENIHLVHVNFGTVLGADGKPMKTRSGTLIGLEGLLDDAVAKAFDVVCDPDRVARMDPPMSAAEQSAIAEVVGIGAIKYADLSHERTSDYKFDVDKMVAMEGNTATYVQYSYARTQSILRKASLRMGSEVSLDSLRDEADASGYAIQHVAERSLTVMLLKFEESLQIAGQHYTPNQLCDYLYETAKAYSVFNEQCRVLDNDDPTVARTRLTLVLLTGTILKLGLDLLGIDVVERM
ncbi:MAG: arginine--tRNA ligase [Planctomycetota bacterium]